MLQVFQPGPRTRENSTEKSEAQSNPSGIQIATRRDFSEDSMKKVFLLIAIPALLVAMGFAQTPAAGGNTDQINIQGCLGGSEGNYNIAEDNTGKIVRITSSSADLKAYQGQDVILIGHKAGTADNGLAVTEVKMVSEHCAAPAAAPAAAAPAAAVSAPADTSSTPPAAAAAPAATASAPAETVSTPAAAAPDTAAPDATSSMSSEKVSTPPDTVIERPAPAAPAATPAAAPAAAAPPAISTPVETASAPAAATAVHRKRSSARPTKPAASPAAAPAPAEPVATPAPVAAAGAARVDSPSEAADATTPAAPAAPAPKPASTRSTLMIVAIVVVVLLIGAGVPLYNRSRRRKLAAQTSGENLSFTHKASSDPGNRDTTGGRKAA
jgi:hypothetical protein